ncbi:hypothetical protein B0A49_10534 [Cryomyces minteri]|uniref:Uncharacterized protein n=1 Tax=Cryomyces minteri TaxID=331657 RepID=A0A4U0WUY0_9PEZI|nr:hypothetical protein B0A49_10534 [Cryomyces minteri]
MDVVQGKQAPPSYLSALHWATFLLQQMTPAYLRPLYSASTQLQRLLSALLTHLTTSPDLASLVLLLLLLLLSLKILDMLRRTLLFWLGLAWKTALYGGAPVAGLWLWQRGPDGALADLQRLRHGWASEYAFWRDQAEVARLVREQMGGAAVGGRAGGRGGAWW